MRPVGAYGEESGGEDSYNEDEPLSLHRVLPMAASPVICPKLGWTRTGQPSTTSSLTATLKLSMPCKVAAPEQQRDARQRR